MKSNTLAIIVGTVASIVAIGVLEVTIWDFVIQNISLSDFTSDLVYSPTGEALLSSILFFFGMIVGGYVTGRIARQDPLHNSAIMALVAIALTVAAMTLEIIFYATKEIPYELPLIDFISFVVDMFIVFTGAVIGGYLSQTSKK